jgi:aminopeptidase N
MRAAGGRGAVLVLTALVAGLLGGCTGTPATTPATSSSSSSSPSAPPSASASPGGSPSESVAVKPPQTSGEALARVSRVPVPQLRGATTASLGDPLFPGLGNGGYDVQRYDLRLTYPKADARQAVRGGVTVTARATRQLSALDLDFSGRGVTAVTVDGRRAAWQRRGAELVVRPAAAIASGSTFTVAVEGFTVTPVTSTDENQGKVALLLTPDGTALAGQPAAMHTVFPCNDHPSDKAAFGFTLDVPKGWTAVANGDPAGSTTSAGRTVWRYRQDEPMATELVQVAAGAYDLVERPADAGVPVRDVVPRRLAATLGPALAAVSGQIAWMAQRVGPYPFSRYGRLAVDAQLSALETQTLTIFAKRYADDGPGPLGQVLLHELAHQWFGDTVSPAQWSDVWLNEGHASWYEVQWGEEHRSLQEVYGAPSVEALLRQVYAGSDRLRAQYGPPAAPGSARGLRDLFNVNVYVGGALALYALRQEIGVPAFEEIERRWVRDHRDQVASTADFIALASQVARRDLEPFLGAWLYGRTTPPMPGRPDWQVLPAQ